MIIILTILIGSAILVTYVLIEKRINQRRCSECGYSVSIDAVPEQCPHCGSTIDGDETDL
jgi:Zn finger protein HypA/HybF involved in hydrogenase expression